MKQFDHKSLHQQIHQYIKSLGYKRAPEGDQSLTPLQFSLSLTKLSMLQKRNIK